MTYCVGMKIDRGLVFMSDTRTNAGLDNISIFSKMRCWSEPGERVIVLLGGESRNDTGGRKPSGRTHEGSG